MEEHLRSGLMPGDIEKALKGGEMEVSKRYRVNIKETAKHEKYFECTVDATGLTMEEVLKDSDALVVELDKRYPPNLNG